MTALYRSLAGPLVALVLVALGLRLAWELVEPVLVPLAVIGLVVTTLAVLYRRR